MTEKLINQITLLALAYILDVKKVEDFKKDLEKLTETIESLGTEKQCDIPVIISRFFTDMAKKHNVKVEDLSVHISDKSLQVQEYTPGHITEYTPLEVIPLNDDSDVLMN